MGAENARLLADLVFDRVCASASRVERPRWTGLDENEQYSPRALLRSRVPAGGFGRSLHGHFDGQPGLPDARQTLLAILLFKELAADAVLLVLARDGDSDPDRRGGFLQGWQKGGEPVRALPWDSRWPTTAA